MLGSLVYVGGMSVEEAAIEGIDGATVEGELDRIGYLGPAPLPPRRRTLRRTPCRQGPVLEAEKLTIGQSPASKALAGPK